MRRERERERYTTMTLPTRLTRELYAHDYNLSRRISAGARRRQPALLLLRKPPLPPSPFLSRSPFFCARRMRVLFCRRVAACIHVCTQPASVIRVNNKCRLHRVGTIAPFTFASCINTWTYTSRSDAFSLSLSLSLRERVAEPATISNLCA